MVTPLAAIDAVAARRLAHGKIVVDPGCQEAPVLATRLLHPAILEALGSAGHGSRIPIGDGNCPLATRCNPIAKRVLLNLEPGRLAVAEVLGVLAEAVPIEAAHVMGPDDGSEPSIDAEFRQLLPGLELQRFGRSQFYDLATETDTALAIATGEQRIFANILLTIGVVPLPTPRSPAA
jgi:L-fucose mutarotase